MYIDESGTSTISSKKDSTFLVLTGWIVEDAYKKEAEDEFRKIKAQFYSNPEIEIKSHSLRNAAPDVSNASPLKLTSMEQYDSLEHELADYLKALNGHVICIAIHKGDYCKQYPGQNPYDAAYIFLLERFQTFLNIKNAFGVCIVDPREDATIKRLADKDLGTTHEQVRWSSAGFWKQCPRIIERALFASSNTVAGLQLADLYSYPTFNIFEYNKKRDEYWRFRDITYPITIRPSRHPQRNLSDPLWMARA